MNHPEPTRPAPGAIAPDPATPGDEVSRASRRTFLASAGAATVAGAAVVTGVGIVTAGAAAAAPVTTTAAPRPGAGRRQAVVAYVRDAAAGEVRLMSGEREVVVHDHALARTLTRHFDEQER